MIRVLVLVCTLLMALPALAQDMPQEAPAQSPVPKSSSAPLLMLSRGKPTHPERVVMTWHKMVKQTPDFSVWAKQSPYLRTANPMDKDNIINGEMNRLQQEWNDFDANQMIDVQTLIHLNDYSTLQEQLVVDEFTPKTFFSFMMYGDNIAIVPQGAANFNKIKIPKADMDDMLSKAHSGQVIAEIILKPLEADSKTPFVQNGVSYWLILTKIEEIRFWSTITDKSDLLWMYRAPDYKPNEDKSLLDLKAGATIQ